MKWIKADYYTTEKPFTFEQFIETEVEERGNYTIEEAEEWKQKYNISDKDKVIWVTPNKIMALRYYFSVEDWDKMEEVAETEEGQRLMIDLNVYTDADGTIIPETDDGDEGYLLVLKK